MPNIYVHMLPELLAGTDLSGSSVVVIDVLRASTTIIHALANGARAVFPCLSIEDAWALASRFPEAERLLGGERKGQLIPGFDLDNSPLQYTPDRVRGKVILFTTTNGTRALLQSAAARRVSIGAFVNLTAVVTAHQQNSEPLHLLCAGTGGQLTAEDILFAGAVADRLVGSERQQWSPGNVQAQMAMDFSRAHSGDSDEFRRTIFESLGARDLIQLGHQPDIERAMQHDLFDCVPFWEPPTNRISLGQHTPMNEF
jgi:2-phosphosulfolactate phosphatase